MKLYKTIFFYVLFALIYVLSVDLTYAQFINLTQYEELYPGCVDNQESTIYGGTYKDAWPPELNLPDFPGGGDVELTRYIYHNLEYPDVVDSISPGATPEADSIVHRPKGVVMVQVVIDRCGRATRQEVIQSVCTEYDMEAMRILESMPIFKPGAINGVRVKVAYIIPINFERNTLRPKQEEQEYYNVDDYDSW